LSRDGFRGLFPSQQLAAFRGKIGLKFFRETIETPPVLPYTITKREREKGV
jgi:hypothetical protein